MFGDKNEAKISGDNNLILQDIQGSVITINLNDQKELREFLINFQSQLGNLPIDILNHLKEHQNLEAAPIVGANLFFTVLAQLNMAPPHRGEELFSLTITNLTKEIRYFSQPYFKTIPPIRMPIPGTENFDSFIMFNRENQQFPVRLEYGQVFTLTYPVMPAAIPFFQAIADYGSYMQAFVLTTLGELYSSNQYDIHKFLEQYENLPGHR